MIQPFNLRHIPLILRLQKEGVALCPEEALTQSINPLGEALISYLPRRASTHTYVLDYRENDQRLLGFAQIRTRYGLPEGEVAFIAPSLVDGNGTYATWQRLLTYLCVVAGEQQGHQRLYARMSHDGEERHLFRHIGFIPYTQENIYRLDQIPPQATDTPGLSNGRAVIRPQTVGDSWGVQRLYAAVSPRLVQQVEGSARGQWEIRRGLLGNGRDRQGYVLEVQGEILACLQLRCGSRGSWLRILLPPQAYDWADTLVQQGLHLPEVHAREPLYCSVRDYEGGVRGSLDRLGFRFFARQTVMVKRTTVWAKEPLPKLLPALDARVEGAAPTMSKFRPSRLARDSGRTPQHTCLEMAEDNDHEVIWQEHAYNR